MKKIGLITLFLCMILMGFSQYKNINEFKDTLVIRTNKCCLYKTNQTTYIYDTASYIINVPKNTILTSYYFDGLYYKVVFENCVGYIFCSDVYTPDRILQIQNILVNNTYTDEIKDSINNNYKINNDDVEIIIEQDIIDQSVNGITIQQEIINQTVNEDDPVLNSDTIYFLQMFIEMFIIGI
jgi:hypothetical protein